MTELEPAWRSVFRVCVRTLIEWFKNFPSNQEIDAFIQNVEKLTFTSDTSVTTGTDTKDFSISDTQTWSPQIKHG